MVLFKAILWDFVIQGLSRHVLFVSRDSSSIPSEDSHTIKSQVNHHIIVWPWQTLANSWTCHYCAWSRSANTNTIVHFLPLKFAAILPGATFIETRRMIDIGTVLFPHPRIPYHPSMESPPLAQMRGNQAHDSLKGKESNTFSTKLHLLPSYLQHSVGRFTFAIEILVRIRDDARSCLLDSVVLELADSLALLWLLFTLMRCICLISHLLLSTQHFEQTFLFHSNPPPFRVHSKW